MKLTGCCGLDCGKCPARTAYLNNDNELRRKTALEWSQLYGAKISPETVNCTGCREEGVKFPHCEQGCEIRKCAMKKGVKNCGECGEFPCSSIEEFFRMVPEARKNLND